MFKIILFVFAAIIFSWSVITVIELKDLLPPEVVTIHTRLFISWFPLLFVLWVFMLIIYFKRKAYSINNDETSNNHSS